MSDPKEDSERRLTRYGLVGVVVAFVAIASMHAFQEPPFRAPDEAAHLGYAHMVADFELPEIDDPMPVPAWAAQWAAERASAPTSRHTTVWVANHPPLHYVLVVPLVWIAEVTERPDGGLLFLRLANIGFAAVGVVLTYLLARELTGGRRVALAAAAVAALTTQAEVVFGQAMIDGLAFAAGTAVVLAGLRCLRRGSTGDNLALLGVTAAIAAGARTATMLLAVAVVGAVALDALTRRDRPEPVRGRLAAGVLAAGLLPAALLFGWFYVRNVVRYGDIGASQYLMDRFGNVAERALLAQVVDVDQWLETVRRLLAPTATTTQHPRFIVPVLVAAVVGLAVVVIIGRTGDGKPVSRRSIVLLIVAVSVVAATFAQHVAAGGNDHPRYLLPALGVLATLIVVGLDRLVPRVLPVLVVVAMAWWSLAHVPRGVDPMSVLRQRDRGAWPPAILRVLPTGPFWRAVAAGGIVIGCATALVAMVWCLRIAQRSSASSEPDQSMSNLTP